MVDKGPFFSMFGKIRLCGGLKFLKKVNGIVGFGGLNLFFSYLEWTKSSKYNIL